MASNINIIIQVYGVQFVASYIRRCRKHVKDALVRIVFICYVLLCRSGDTQSDWEHLAVPPRILKADCRMPQHIQSQTERYLEKNTSSQVPSDTSFCVVLQWYRSINDTAPSADMLIYIQYIYLIILRIQFLWFNQYIILIFHYNHGLSEFSVTPWSWQMLCALRRDRVDVKMDLI